MEKYTSYSFTYNAAITGNESGVVCVLMFEALALVAHKARSFCFPVHGLVITMAKFTV